jgi:tRNA(Ile)-lysidine synthase
MALSLHQAMEAFKPRLPLGVGFSGGADSTALLLACAAKWPGQVVALHVHHGLQSAADGFEAHCRKLCAHLNIPLRVAHVDARAVSGQSPEDAARRSRYAAFKHLATDGPELGSVALAQHADDQVETLLLALSRGSGLPGLSAMPATWQRDGLIFYRPLLQVSGLALRDYLRERQQVSVEDPTNTDVQFTRNRIRAQVLPALEASFASFRDTFARSAAHAADAQSLLQELAASDLATLTSASNACASDAYISIQALQQLSRLRQTNVLRHWLVVCHGTQASAAQMHELLDQVYACTTRGHRLHIKVGSGFVERQGSHLRWYNEQL